jgi:phosphate acetyltransferase
MLQGLNKPVNDLNGCTVDDIINTVVITAIQAQVVNQL